MHTSKLTPLKNRDLGPPTPLNHGRGPLDGQKALLAWCLLYRQSMEIAQYWHLGAVLKSSFHTLVYTQTLGDLVRICIDSGVLWGGLRFCLRNSQVMPLLMFWDAMGSKHWKCVASISQRQDGPWCCGLPLPPCPSSPRSPRVLSVYFLCAAKHSLQQQYLWLGPHVTCDQWHVGHWSSSLEYKLHEGSIYLTECCFPRDQHRA